MAMKNIEMFDLYVGRIFAKLYEAFPLRVDVDVCVECGKEIDQQELYIPKECEIYYDTLVWLEKSGFLHIDRENRPYGFGGVVLSAKGLELLKSTPKSVKHQDGIGEKIRDLVVQGRDEALRKSVNELLHYAAGAVFG